MRSDKEQTREYHREWYRKNKEKRRLQIKEWQIKRQESWKSFKSTLKCKLCEENSPCCLDFHHLDPNEKDVALSQVANRWSDKRLEQELSKCIVLCSNCHRKIHAGLIQLVE